MVHVEGSITIRRSVEEVFDFVADERNEVTFNPDMRSVTKLTDGPVGRGARFRAETMMGRRPVEMEIEFTEYERPSRLGSATQMSTMDLSGTLTFEPVAAGTTMRWSWDLRPKGWLRFLGPVVRVMGERSERRIWEGLKRHLEERND